MVFFFIGAPYKGSADAVWGDIQKYVLSGGISTSAKGKQLPNEMNRFKLGNLDSLMFINDNLIKQDTALESLLKKVERQYLDITEKNFVEFTIESRGQSTSVENFLMDFKWDDSRFPRNSPLADIIKNLQNRTNVVDNDLRQKISSYQDIKNQAQQIARKEGNLLVRDLVDVLKEPIVKPKDFVNSQYVTTVVAIVPKQQVPEFLACYQLLNENVIPGSAKQFQVDDKDNLTIWRVSIMKTPIDKEIQIVEDEKKKNKYTPVEDFVIRARDKLKQMITIRDFEFKANESRDREKQRHEIKSKSDNLTNVLKQACEKAFSDLYVTYIHLKFLRVIVDIAMRFGSQEQSFTCVIKPEQGKEKKVQQQLLKLFADPSQMGLYGTKEELEDTEDFFPFVYVPVNVP